MSEPESAEGLAGSRLVVQGLKVWRKTFERFLCTFPFQKSLESLVQRGSSEQPLLQLAISRSLQNQECLQHHLPKAPQVFFF